MQIRGLQDLHVRELGLLQELADGPRHGGGREDDLQVAVVVEDDRVQELHDVPRETLRQHCVHLVNDDLLHLRHVEVALLPVLPQAAGGGDHHVHWAVQGAALLAIVLPPHDQRGRDLGVVRQGLQHREHLLPQLPGRHKHDGARALGQPLDARQLLGLELLDDRQEVGQGLAGAGGGGVGQALPAHQAGDDHLLDGGRGRDAHPPQPLLQLRDHPHDLERRRDPPHLRSVFGGKRWRGSGNLMGSSSKRGHWYGSRHRRHGCLSLHGRRRGNPKILLPNETLH
mmetsp:Transcript_78690/g.131939  ORF Transcript_78690/g.131939 Transcript_78690/m.131939 type:complete len:284 (-) Transcript_78690:204-1055(-)